MSNAETLFIFVVREWGLLLWLGVMLAAALTCIDKPFEEVKLGVLAVVLNPLALTLHFYGLPDVEYLWQAIILVLAMGGVVAYGHMVWVWVRCLKERKGGEVL